MATQNVKYFRSTDTGAPTLFGNIPGATGNAGSLIGLLRAILINGYNSQTASSVTVASNVATFNCTSHGFVVGQCLLCAGVTGGPTGYANFNTELYVATAAANSFTVATSGISDGTLTGTITAKVAPAGWTEPYSSTTNITAFKQPGGNGFYFNIDESAAQVSRVTGFESMTAVGVANGTGAFPTSVQLSGGVYWNRSSTTDTTQRPWLALVTDRHLLIYVNPDSSATGANGSIQGMTDLRVYKAGDIYATLLVGNATSTTTISQSLYLSGAGTAATGHFMTRSYTQIGSSVTVGKTCVDSVIGTGVYAGASGLTYPCPVDSGNWMSPIRCYEAATGLNAPRGEMVGVWCPMHTKPLTHLDTFSGTGSLAGKSFVVVNGYNGGQLFLETSNTWIF